VRGEKQYFTLVLGPRDGQRIVLDNAYISLVVPKPQKPIKAYWSLMEPDASGCVFETIEYCRVRGVPGVLAPRGTAPELVIDMLVQKYA
jgi:hypothetical protein